MGQVSKSSIWSTRGGLRWSEEEEYKGEKPHYRGDHQKSKEESLYTQEL